MDPQTRATALCAAGLACFGAAALSMSSDPAAAEQCQQLEDVAAALIGPVDGGQPAAAAVTHQPPPPPPPPHLPQPPTRPTRPGRR